MEPGMLSLHLLTKAVLGEDVTKPRVLPGNFDFSFHFPDADKRPALAKSSAARHPSTTRWRQDVMSAKIQSPLQPRLSSPKVDVKPCGQIVNVEAEDTFAHAGCRGCERYKESGKGAMEPELNVAKNAAQTENTEQEQQNFLGEWLGRGEAQPQTPTGETDEGDASRGEAERLRFASGQKTRAKTASINKVTRRLRCRNVLMAYALLDPYDRGYVDVDEAAQTIARIQSFRETSEHAGGVAELLLVMVQDLLPYISSRGVIEKDDFLEQIYSRVEADYAGVTPYFCLRSNANPLVHARHERELYTSLFSRAFYGGDYVADGVALHEAAETRDTQNGSYWHHGSPLATYPHGRPNVPGNLADHVQQGQLRSRRRRALIKEEELMKEMEECTFHPMTTTLRGPLKKIFQSKKQIRETLRVRRQNELRYRYPPVVRDLDTTVKGSVALPPDMDLREKEKFEECRKKAMLGRTKDDDAACETFVSRSDSYNDGSPGTTNSARAGSTHGAQGCCKPDLQDGDDFMKERVPPVYVIHNGDPPPQPEDWGLPLRDDWITQLPTDDSGSEKDRETSRRVRRGRDRSERRSRRTPEAHVRRETRALCPTETSSEIVKEYSPLPSTTQSQSTVRTPYLMHQEKDLRSQSVVPQGRFVDLDVKLACDFSIKEIPVYYREAIERLLHKELAGTNKSKSDYLILQKAKQISEKVMSMAAGRSAQGG